MRYKNWKMYFGMVSEAPAGFMGGVVPYHWTQVVNIKRDPFETSIGEHTKTLFGMGGALGGPVTAYVYDWNMLPIGQALWLKELETYIDFPPLQDPAIVARRLDDRALFHPVGAIAGRRGGRSHLAPSDGNHHGRDAARRWLCHRDVRQVASRRPALQPAAEQGLRRVLRHPARRYLGRVPDDSPGPADQDARDPAGQGPQIVEAKRGEPLKTVKPYTAEVRREIDWELVDRGVDFMQRQKAAGKPFFLYLPISRTHFPNLPSKRFEGQSRIGQFGDSLMEGDAIVGRMLDALQVLGLEQDTIVVFASDNGPQGEVVREFGGDMPDMGSPGPYRGELGDASEGSIRTAAMIRWPGQIRPSSVRDVLDHGFLPDTRAPGGGKVPDDRPIDGVDQTDLLLGASDTGRRDALLTFVGPDLVAVRWKQFRAYFADVAPGRSGWGGAHSCGDGEQRGADERLPQGLQYRVGSARGAQHRSVIRVGDRTDVEGCGGLQGQPPEISEPAGGEIDALVIDLWMGAPALLSQRPRR